MKFMDSRLTELGWRTSFAMRQLESVASDLAKHPEWPTTVFEAGNTLAHYAATAAWPELMGLLRDQGAALDWVNGRGEAAIHVAALYGDVSTLRVLVESGVAPNLQGFLFAQAGTEDM